MLYTSKVDTVPPVVFLVYQFTWNAFAGFLIISEKSEVANLEQIPGNLHKSLSSTYDGTPKVSKSSLIMKESATHPLCSSLQDYDKYTKINSML